MTTTSPTDPDGLAVLHVLNRRQEDEALSSEDMYNAMQGVRNMSGQNAVVLLGAKIDAQNVEIRARNANIVSKIDALTANIDALTANIDAVTDQLRALRWMVVATLIMVLVMAGALVALAIQSFSKPGPSPPSVQAVEAPPRPVAVDADLPMLAAPDSR